MPKMFRKLSLDRSSKRVDPTTKLYKVQTSDGRSILVTNSGRRTLEAAERSGREFERIIAERQKKAVS